MEFRSKHSLLRLQRLVLHLPGHEDLRRSSSGAAAAESAMGHGRRRSLGMTSAARQPGIIATERASI
jgi:hypothetical protein